MPPPLLCGAPKTYRLSFPHLEIYSIMAPKYKKSSTPSTMTALRVAPQQRAHHHVDISLVSWAFSLRACHFNQRDPARARARSYPIHNWTLPTHNKRWHLAPNSRRYPLAACCPPRFVPCHVVTFILYPNARTRLPLSCVSSPPLRVIVQLPSLFCMAAI